MRGLGANCCGNGGANASPDASSLHRFPNLTLKGLPGASFPIRQRCSHRATTPAGAGLSAGVPRGSTNFAPAAARYLTEFGRGCTDFVGGAAHGFWWARECASESNDSYAQPTRLAAHNFPSSHT